jgi:hypothetical protein
MVLMKIMKFMFLGGIILAVVAFFKSLWASMRSCFAKCCPCCCKDPEQEKQEAKEAKKKRGFFAKKEKGSTQEKEGLMPGPNNL